VLYATWWKHVTNETFQKSAFLPGSLSDQGAGSEAPGIGLSSCQPLHLPRGGGREHLTENSSNKLLGLSSCHSLHLPRGGGREHLTENSKNKLLWAVQLSNPPQNTEYRIQNTEYRMQNAEYRIQNTECRIQNTETHVLKTTYGPLIDMALYISF
jgi:hypothetical protein